MYLQNNEPLVTPRTAAPEFGGTANALAVFLCRPASCRLTRRLYLQKAQKKTHSAFAKAGFSAALAEFIKRPQAEVQIGACRKLTLTIIVVTH